MGSGYSKRKKQARELQKQFSEMQKNIENTEVTGSAGNGLVTLTLTGNQELKKIKINPECVDPEDIEGLEDLIKAAHNDAQEKLGSKEKGMPGMPNIPGMPDLGGLGF